MYFIPRNNAIYSYIAHTDKKRRYFATLFILVMTIMVLYYGMYKPLIAHITLYQVELDRLQKQYEESQQSKKNSKEFLLLIDTNKKNISEYVITEDKREEHCSKQMHFVFDVISQLGLTLNDYGACKEQDKKWYIKDSAHCQITGSLEKILSFLKRIKDAEQLIAVSHLVLARAKENLFRLSCNIGIMSIKKPGI